MLGQLPVPGRPTNLDYSRARAYCACSRCGWGLFGHFFLIYHFSFLSPSLWETARYRLKYCLIGPLSPKQPTNQPTIPALVFLCIYAPLVIGNTVEDDQLLLKFQVQLYMVFLNNNHLAISLDISTVIFTYYGTWKSITGSYLDKYTEQKKKRNISRLLGPVVQQKISMYFVIKLYNT